MSSEIAEARLLAKMLTELDRGDENPMWLSRAWTAGIGQMILDRLPEVSEKQDAAARRFMGRIFRDIPAS